MICSTGYESASDYFKHLFDEKIKGLNLKVNSFCIANEENYKKLINEVIDAKNRTNKKPVDYRRLKRYDILKVSGLLKLILPLSKSVNDNVKYYVHNGELFDILKKSHLETSHGGLHKMHISLKNEYANITRPVIQIFLANCKTCEKKRKRNKMDYSVKPKVSNEAIVSEAVQLALIDLIDMRQCKDHEYGFILKYQDHTSKFIVLRPLKTKAAEEIGHNLIDIFCVLGAPAILQIQFYADDNHKLINALTEQFKITWPQIIIRQDKPRLPQGMQGCSTESNLRNTLNSWMTDNRTTRWSDGLRFCQYQKNNSFNPVVKKSPFEAFFSKKPKSDNSAFKAEDSIPYDLSSVNNLKYNNINTKKCSTDQISLTTITGNGQESAFDEKDKIVKKSMKSTFCTNTPKNSTKTIHEVSVQQNKRIKREIIPLSDTK